MPATLFRFTSSVVITEARRILHNIDLDNRGWIGGIGEIMGFSATSSLHDRQKIEGYLAHKWGLVGYLPSDHPYKNDDPLTKDKFNYSSQQEIDPSAQKGNRMYYPNDNRGYYANSNRDDISTVDPINKKQPPNSNT